MRQKKTSFVLFALIACSLFQLNSHAANELAKINGKVITLEEFNSKYKENQKFFSLTPPSKENFLNDLVRRELGIQAAKKMALEKDPEIQERINTVLYHAYVEKKLAPTIAKIQVTNDELENYYKKNPEIRTSHIFIQLRPDANATEEKAALEKIKKIQSTLNSSLKEGKGNFSDIARTYSEGIAAPAGGDIDYQTKDKLDPTYYKTALGLGKVGQISPIIRTQFGYHIVKLTGIREFKDVDRGLYKRLIFDEKRTQLFNGFMDKLQQQSAVTINKSLIK